jgi:hypothetical protein
MEDKPLLIVDKSVKSPSFRDRTGIAADSVGGRRLNVSDEVRPEIFMKDMTFWREFQNRRPQLKW